jgi:hypothetical protein
MGVEKPMTANNAPDSDPPDGDSYVAPTVIVLGSLAELTGVKALNASDGASFFGVPEGAIS